MFSRLKKILKKMCVFGASTATVLSFSSYLVKSAAPTSNTYGKRVGSFTTIEKADDPNFNFESFAQIILNGATTADENSSVDYTGSKINLISSVVKVGYYDDQNREGTLRYEITTLDGNPVDDDPQVHLYLRVSDSDAPPSNDSDWVKYENANTLTSNDKLKRKDAGTYYVYYYIDGAAGGTDNTVKDTPSSNTP